MANNVMNQAIIHLCDIKVRVENFIASNNPAGRFGGQNSFNVWPERYARLPIGNQLSLDGALKQAV